VPDRPDKANSKCYEDAEDILKSFSRDCAPLKNQKQTGDNITFQCVWFEPGFDPF
jgi:hypothetical protein